MNFRQKLVLRERLDVQCDTLFTFLSGETMRHLCLILFFCEISVFSSMAQPLSGPLPPIRTVFIILEENRQWADVTPSVAPYMNNTLIPLGGHATQYYNPPGLHPSEPD